MSNVAQIALQAAAVGTIKISRIYLLRKAPAGIHQPETSSNGEARQWYQLNGQPAPQGFKGIAVSKGKKVMRP